MGVLVALGVAVGVGLIVTVPVHGLIVIQTVLFIIPLEALYPNGVEVGRGVGVGVGVANAFA